MDRYEYEITVYSVEDFKEVIYFCSADGQCNLERIPTDQLRKLEGVMSERGLKGWELVQANFGKDGVLAFWKRSLPKGGERGGEEIES